MKAKKRIGIGTLTKIITNSPITRFLKSFFLSRKFTLKFVGEMLSWNVLDLKSKSSRIYLLIYSKSKYQLSRNYGKIQKNEKFWDHHHITL